MCITLSRVTSLSLSQSTTYTWGHSCRDPPYDGSSCGTSCCLYRSLGWCTSSWSRSHRWAWPSPCSGGMACILWSSPLHTSCSSYRGLYWRMSSMMRMKTRTCCCSTRMKRMSSMMMTRTSYTCIPWRTCSYRRTSSYHTYPSYRRRP